MNKARGAALEEIDDGLICITRAADAPSQRAASFSASFYLNKSNGVSAINHEGRIKRRFGMVFPASLYLDGQERHMAGAVLFQSETLSGMSVLPLLPAQCPEAQIVKVVA